MKRVHYGYESGMEWSGIDWNANWNAEWHADWNAEWNADSIPHFNPHAIPHSNPHSFLIYMLITAICPSRLVDPRYPLLHQYRSLVN